jgi:flagellar biosynthesis chaperone FliJ
MENLTELLKQKEDLESQISNTRNAKVLAEISEIDKQVSDLEREKVEALRHREIADPKLLEEIEHHRSEKVRISNLYFGNTHKIQELQNKIIHLSNLRREVKEKLSTTRG